MANYNYVLNELYTTYALITVFVLLMLVCEVFIFRKAGFMGWESIIPIYSCACNLQMIGWHPILCLVSLIPTVGSVFSLVVLYKRARCFGISFGMFLVILFFPLIGFPVWAFSKKYQYEGYK